MPTFHQSPEGDVRMTDIPQILIEICESPLDLNELNAKAQSGSGEIGASVVFTGNVRTATEADGLVAMTLEHYPGMTEHQLSKIVDNAISRWKLNRARRLPHSCRSQQATGSFPASLTINEPDRSDRHFGHATRDHL